MVRKTPRSLPLPLINSTGHWLQQSFDNAASFYFCIWRGLALGLFLATEEHLCFKGTRKGDLFILLQFCLWSVTVCQSAGLRALEAKRKEAHFPSRAGKKGKSPGREGCPWDLALLVKGMGTSILSEKENWSVVFSTEYKSWVVFLLQGLVGNRSGKHHRGIKYSAFPQERLQRLWDEYSTHVCSQTHS